MATWELEAELKHQFPAAQAWRQVDLQDQGNVRYQAVQANEAESSRRAGDKTIRLFACWFQPGLINQPTVFSSHNKSAPAGLISPDINQRTDYMLTSERVDYECGPRRTTMPK